MAIYIPFDKTVNDVIIPASKSYAQRAILAASLSNQPTLIKNIGISNDVQHILKIAEQLGATIKQQNGNVLIHGMQSPMNRNLNCGESGLGIRLTTSIAAVLGGSFDLDGTGSLKKRPMREFDSFLPQIGVNCKSNNGHLPIKISGNAKGAIINLDGRLSSQYLSGLLMALPLLKENSIINVTGLKSKPYISITIDVLKAFDIEIENIDYTQFKIKGNQTYCSEKFTVEGDYSGASIWMVHGALNDGITLKGLNEKSVQADKMMLNALENANVNYKWSDHNLQVFKSPIKAFSFDANHCPDLFPALVVLAAGATGISSIKGANRLTHKESNRAIVLQKEFAKLGLKIELIDDTMEVHGTSTLESGTIDSNNDHRIAMAGAIAANLTNKGVEILDEQSVNKSYPSFWAAYN